jgi:ubiquinone/menaquinone biosynthesis C-methylase UbiE
MLSKLRSVRDYFDSDAGRYGDQRYPDEPRTCEQLSYLVRRRYVLGMLENSGVPPGLVLDLGCGPGVYSNELLDRGWRVRGVDLSPEMLKVAAQRVAGRTGVGFSVGQTTRLPFADATFDAVLCIGVFAYVESEEKTIQEIVRVLKPNGCAVLQIANAFAPIRAEHRLRFELGRRLRSRPPDEEDRFREQVRLAWQQPPAFRALCASAGLIPQEGRFYDFRAPGLARVWPGAGVAVGRAFEHVGDRTWAGWWGAGFLSRYVKKA